MRNIAQHLKKHHVKLYHLIQRNLYRRETDSSNSDFEPKSFAAICDIWTEIQSITSYLGITNHYIMEDEIKSTILGIFKLNDRHTANYIKKKKIKKTFVEWKLDKDKIMAIAMDGAANMIAVCTSYVAEARHLYCFAHKLNVVANSLEDEKNSQLTSSLGKVKKIV